MDTENIEFPVTVECLSGEIVECRNADELEVVLAPEVVWYPVLAVLSLVATGALLAGIHFGFGL